jgi:drug/metabolite transporter (DMT)-like permease
MTSFTRGHLAMLSFSLLIAGSFSFGTRVANLMEPAALMALRFMIAGCLVGVFAIATRAVKREHLRAPWRYLIVGGLFATYFGLMFEGLKTATPVSAAAVFTLTPAIAAIFAWFILGQVTSRWSIGAIIVGGFGALLVIFQGDIDAIKAFDVGRGEQIYFVGCVAHALFIPLLRKFNQGEPVIVATLAMIVAGAMYLLVFGIGDLMTTDFTALPMLFWIALTYLAIFASAATVFLLQYGAMNLPSANVMAYTYLTPIWVMFVEMTIGDASPRPLVWVGIGITVLALLMLLRRDQKV